MAQGETYEEFVEKFKPKKTTDDCYTPRIIYDTVADYVAETYRRDRVSFIRPFWPGGDYEKAEYPDDCTVVDNPPFSMLAQITRFYLEREIKFFLFAPALTIFSTVSSMCCAICCAADITYENGARVKTSFITNLSDARAESSPILYRLIKLADEINTSAGKKTLPKYVYPYEVLTASAMNYMTAHGIAYRVEKDESEFIRGLDAQKPVGKSIYGAGYLLSERAAAERAAAERAAAERAAAERAAAEQWELSERERAIVRTLR